jgi:hypothetical protein
MTIDTRHFSFQTSTGIVSLRCLDDDVNLGTLENCDDEVPSVLLQELAELRDLVQDADEAGLAYEATRRHADETRHNPKGW